MRYFKNVHGVELRRDIYAEQFATETKTNYQVVINDECVDEDEDEAALSRRLTKVAGRLLKIATFLERKAKK